MVGSEIVVPGSISNLGPGFDALSVAIQLYVRVRVVDVRPSARDTIDFDFGSDPLTGENRIESGFRQMRGRVGRPVPGLRVTVESDIPRRAGLGSSGAATVAGIRLYQLASGAGTLDDALATACVVEGHPDNAAASLLGGLTVSCQHGDGRVTARAWRWPPQVRFVVATPDVPLETAKARGVLPSSVPLGDAIYNLQRALLLVHALGPTGDRHDVREALRDRWHQPARAPLVPVLDEALALDHPAVLGVCLSGAGPSIAALTDGDPGEVTALLRTLYDRRRIPCTIRTLDAYQGGIDLPSDRRSL
jgi:homoserine kinase